MNQESQLGQLGEIVKKLESKLEQKQDTSLPSHETLAASRMYNDFASESLLVLNEIGTSVSSIGNSFTYPRSITNKHFDTPKPVDQFYTGRVDEAEQLKNWFLPKSPSIQGRVPEKTHTKQKRFVIYGVGGSGKTQFCCKFAEDNRDQYVYHYSLSLCCSTDNRAQFLGCLLG